MNGKILVTYASNAGSTAEVAQAIGDTLQKHGGTVDVMPTKYVKSLDGYRAVVVGSAVRMGCWLPEAVKFVEQHRDELSQRPTAFFAVHLMNMGSDETSQKSRLAYLDPVRRLVTPKSEAFFAGVGNWKKVTFFESLLGKAVKAPTGDFRDWTAIRGWAEGLRELGFNGSEA